MHLLARIASAPQQRLFDALARCGELFLAVGPHGITANFAGTLRIRRHGLEDMLDVDDGKSHVHVDWSRLKRAEAEVRGAEGLLTFYDGTEPLFRVYRQAGPYPAEVARLAEATLWPSEPDVAAT